MSAYPINTDFAKDSNSEDYPISYGRLSVTAASIPFSNIIQFANSEQERRMYALAYLMVREAAVKSIKGENRPSRIKRVRPTKQNTVKFMNLFSKAPTSGLVETIRGEFTPYSFKELSDIASKLWITTHHGGEPETRAEALFFITLAVYLRRDIGGEQL